MRNTHFRQPNTEAMKGLLAAHHNDRVGVILHLAWLAGLTRDEIVGLRWTQIDAEGAVIRLSDREVPLDAALLRCLREWRIVQGDASARVVDIAPQSVSRLVRHALDEVGQTGVRLLDLHIDFVRRQLQDHDWPYVLRITGFSLTTYRLLFAEFKEFEQPAKPRGSALDDELGLYRLMQWERESPAGIALWLSQHLGLYVREIVALTWDDVDFDAGTLRTARGDVPMSDSLRQVLLEERNRRKTGDDPHVILTPRTRKPMDAARLSTLVRETLIRGGIEDRSLADMKRSVRREEAEQLILDFARANGSVTRGDVTRMLEQSESTSYNRLLELVESGELVRINSRYYLPGTVVPPEQHAEAIKAYIAENRVAYRKDIAELLHIGVRPAAHILNTMAEDGELVLLRRSRCYMLPQDEAARQKKAE